jgi:hypothetical protein
VRTFDRFPPSTAFSLLTMGCLIVCQIGWGQNTTTPKQTDSALTATLRQRQLVTSFTCDQARAAILDPNYGKMPTDELNDVTAVWMNCANTVHNKMYPNNQRVTVVAPVANNPNQPVEIETVDQNNDDQVHKVCTAAASAFYTYAEGGATVQPAALPAVASADVLTDGGKTDCDSFIHGVKTENPLVVLAPSMISGSGVTMHVLSMIGAGQAAATVQSAVDSLGEQVKDSIKGSVMDITQHPLIYVTPQIAKAGPIPVVLPPPVPVHLPPAPNRAVSCTFHPWKGCI